ncbi:phospholipase [Thiohalobacter sp. COW1]|uniref:DISARM system phospholipase D-like protein DrmC n=1 Tax=Thiohalobacter sp. COW1 TaxID=2795687 RepID=UPI001915317D|nr:DISARM system phospholipase D-like protein DrmC [Thiohalobacter sp. COW1]BCO30129.1 phospholipase [Thiohalobacter sp. COW1]
MNDLWRVVAELGLELHPQRMVAIAEKIASLRSIDEIGSIKSSFGPNADPDLICRLERAWRETAEIGPRELSAALKCASATSELASSRGSIELVWTGPSTGLVPVRHTEQVLCEVIDSARYRLFLVSFVAYDVQSIAKALRGAVGRQVQVDVLLETSSAHGGSVSYDSVKVMKESVPSANIYVWKPENENTALGYARRAVHAKCAVADGALAFITSANLSTAAMERNMELGVMIKGGSLPDNLDRHLDALVNTGIVETV